MMQRIRSVILLILINEIMGSQEPVTIEFEVSENPSLNEPIGNVIEKLREKRFFYDQSKLSFKLLNEGNDRQRNLPESLVRIDSYGNVRVSHQLDREAICSRDPECIITLFVTTEGLEKDEIEMSYFSLKLHVKDVNDNPPVFLTKDPEKTLFINEESEKGTVILLPKAIDKDTAINGVVSYSFDQTKTDPEMLDKFEIHQYRGEPSECGKKNSHENENLNQDLIACLKSIGRLDREHKSEYKFTLKATDSKGLNSEIDLKLLLRDLNDHAPVWSDILIARNFKAVPSQFFSSSHFNTIQVEANKKINDPIVTYNIQIPECSPKRSQIMVLKASDEDSSEVENGKLGYRIAQHSSNYGEIVKHFEILDDRLYLTDGGLSKIALERIEFLVTAFDGAGKHTDARINVTIEDCNDHAPRITVILRTSKLMENSINAGIVVAMVRVVDADRPGSPNAKFECHLNDTMHLELKKISQPFKNQILYQIETVGNTPFDREISPLYHVIITCKDHGVPFKTEFEKLSIEIGDVNDNAPIFVKSDVFNAFKNSGTSRFIKSFTVNTKSVEEFIYSISENASPATKIGELTAIDFDDGENAKIDYHLVQKNENASELPFLITNQGIIQLISTVDREKKDSYLLKVRAENPNNKSLSVETNVVVKINDVNDCEPEFTGNTVFELQESKGNTTIHQFIGKLTTEDRDLGKNGSVKFRLANALEVVGMDLSPICVPMPIPSRKMMIKCPIQISRDGKITVSGIVDREVTPLIKIGVVAEDEGTPNSLSRITTLTIHVLDLNDNKPEFVLAEDYLAQGIYSEFVDPMLLLPRNKTVRISIDTPIGSPIVQIYTRDLDSNENGTVKYSLINHNSRTAANLINDNQAVENQELYSLQPDGKLILTRELVDSKLFLSSTPVHVLNRLRQRRPDHLMIKAQDSGPHSEASLMRFEIQYYDPLEEDISIKTNTQGQPYQDRRYPYTSADRNHLNSQNRLSLFGPKSIPILYGLATCVFFIFVIVIITLISLYLRNRKLVAIQNKNIIPKNDMLGEAMLAFNASNNMDEADENGFSMGTITISDVNGRILELGTSQNRGLYTTPINSQDANHYLTLGRNRQGGTLGPTSYPYQHFIRVPGQKHVGLATKNNSQDCLDLDVNNYEEQSAEHPDDSGIGPDPDISVNKKRCRSLGSDEELFQEAQYTNLMKIQTLNSNPISSIDKFGVNILRLQQNSLMNGKFHGIPVSSQQYLNRLNQSGPSINAIQPIINEEQSNNLMNNEQSLKFTQIINPDTGRFVGGSFV